MLNRVLKIWMDFLTTGLMCWSTFSYHQNHQTSRSILVDDLLHPYTMPLNKVLLPKNITWIIYGGKCKDELFVKILLITQPKKLSFGWTLEWSQFSKQIRPDSSQQWLVTNHKSQSNSQQSHLYTAWVMTKSAKGSGGTALFTVLFEVGQSDHTVNNGLYYREGA